MINYTKYKTKTFALIINLIFFISTGYAQQYTLQDNDVIVTNGVITSCSYTFELKNIIIPQILDEQTIIGIADGWYSGAGVFNNKGITSVELPSTLETIGEYAFYNNDLTSLDLSGSTALVTIGKTAFYSNSITTLDMSGCMALTTIGESAFSDNKLTSLNLSGCTSLVTIGNSAFYSNSISALDLTNCIALSTIGESSFSINSIATLDLSDCKSLSVIGEFAFSYNKLVGLNLTNCKNLLSIGSHAFYGNTSLTGFILPEVTYNEVVYTTWKDGNDSSYTAGTDMVIDFETYYIVFIPYTLTDNDVEVEGGVITSCNYNFELKNIIIPQILDGQTVIGIADGWYSGAGVFNYKGITSAELPPTLENIGEYAFHGNDLISLDLSACAALVTIGKSAFYSNSIITLNLSGCTALTTIGESAFSDNKLTGLNLSGCTSLVTIGNSAFYSNSISALDLTNCIALSTFGESSFSLNTIATLDLSDCKALSIIGEFAFSYNKLAGLDLTNCKNLLSIGGHAFYGNTSLTGFILPEVTYNEVVYTSWKDGNDSSYIAGTDIVTNFETYYITYIPYTLNDNDVVVEGGVIASCSYNFELKNIIIPQTLDGQTVIGIADSWYPGGGIFSDKGIISVELPPALETIGEYAFYSNDLIRLDLTGCKELTNIGNYAFYSNSIITLDLSNCTVLATIGSSAFSYNKLTGLDLTSCSNLLSIGSDAFYGNFSIYEFTLPDPVIPGYLYSCWIDGNGVRHDAVDKVNDLLTSYTRIMPEIIDINPVYGPTSGNTEITFTGKNFENEKNGKEVLFNGIEPLNYKFWSDTLIILISPPNPEGASKIEISLENNLSYTSPKQFFYTNDDMVVVCGNVSGTWETGETYLLKCTVSIPENEILVLEKGVRIIAMSGEQIRFECFGRLEINGTEDNPVHFTSTSGKPGSWGGINILGTFYDCKLNYCIIENAITAISLYAWAEGCSSESNYSEIKNCIIRNNSKDGISCSGEGDYSTGCSIPKTGSCSPLIQDCQIYNNYEDGIDLSAYDGYLSNGYIGANVYNNLIYNNTNGIYCHGDDYVEPDIINNVISMNSGAGIKSSQINFRNEYYIIANNIITKNAIGILNEDTTAINSNTNGFWINAEDFQGIVQDVSNIFEDPLFVDFQNHNFNLQANSPCIDAGSNDLVNFETDFTGKVRIFDGSGNGNATVDIGAYEYGAPCSQIEIDSTICEGNSIQIGDSIFTQTGSYSVKLSNIHGCDSIVNLNLLIFTVDTTVSRSGSTLISNASGAEYQWLNCEEEYTGIVGETSQSYAADRNGSYAVEVTQAGCPDTSGCYEISTVGIIENNFGSGLTFYPNPTHDRITMDLGNFYTDVNVIIKNISGQVISVQNYPFVRELIIDINGTNGLYLIEIFTKENKKAIFKVIKE